MTKIEQLDLGETTARSRTSIDVRVDDDFPPLPFPIHVLVTDRDPMENRPDAVLAQLTIDEARRLLMSLSRAIDAAELHQQDAQRSKP